MRIAISGAGGFIGSRLSSRLSASGHEIVRIGRAELALPAVELAGRMAGCGAVVHLAGAPVVARWTAEHRRLIMESRVNATRAIACAIAAMDPAPSLLVSASAVGIYKSSGTHDESSREYGDGFLAGVCRAWENEAGAAGIRTAVFRFGAVLSKEGGALGAMLLPFRLGLGGVIGDGSQNFSWISMEDALRAFEHVLSHPTLSGVFNIVSPEPATNASFTAALAAALHRPAFIPVPAFALRAIFADGATIMTDGQAAVPRRLLESGFEFKYPDLGSALRAALEI